MHVQDVFEMTFYKYVSRNASQGHKSSQLTHFSRNSAIISLALLCTAHLIVPAGYCEPTRNVPPMSPCSGVPMSERVYCEVPAQPTSQVHSGDRTLQLPIFVVKPAV